MLVLQIILASTRPGRIGLPVANWFHKIAKTDPAFATELLDLAEIGLPFLDEPHHPRLQKYQHEHTKAWSRTIARADAYVLVTPEYNYSFPATLKNALDYLVLEWGEKPVGFVSYGGQSGGLRSVQQLKQVTSALKMFPVNEAVAIPFVHQQRNETGEFVATDLQDQAARVMLKELARLAEFFRQLRTG